MNIFATDHPIGPKPIERRTKIIVAGIIITLVAAVALFLWHIDGPRVVARAVAPDGTEMCIVQQCNWNAELFTTSFVYGKPGTGWRRFYYDHEDGYWWHAWTSVDPDMRIAVFYRGGSEAVTFSWASETYTLHRWRRIDTEPDQMPVGWSPQISVFSKR